MTAKDVEGAMEIECALGEKRRAAERAKWFRAGLEAAAKVADEHSAACADSFSKHPAGSVERDSDYYAAQEALFLAERIRALPIPESDNG